MVGINSYPLFASSEGMDKERVEKKKKKKQVKGMRILGGENFNELKIETCFNRFLLSFSTKSFFNRFLFQSLNSNTPTLSILNPFLVVSIVLTDSHLNC